VRPFNTDVASNGYCYTDSNGREMMQRLKDYRPTWPFVQSEPVAGNYFPVNALFFLNDTNTQFNVFTDTSVGGGSINNGEIYLTVQRRLVADDSRGVGEPLNETEFTTPYLEWDNLPDGASFGNPLIVRGRFTVTVGAGAATVPMRRTREVQDEKYFTPLVLFPSSSVSNSLRGSMLNAPLPFALQLMTAQLVDPKTLLVRLSHQYAVNEDPVYSTPVTLDLTSLFAFPVVSIDEYSLMTTELTKEAVSAVTIGPMDIRTFVFHL